MINALVRVRLRIQTRTAGPLSSIWGCRRDAKPRDLGLQLHRPSCCVPPPRSGTTPRTRKRPACPNRPGLPAGGCSGVDDHRRHPSGPKTLGWPDYPAALGHRMPSRRRAGRPQGVKVVPPGGIVRPGDRPEARAWASSTCRMPLSALVNGHFQTNGSAKPFAYQRIEESDHRHDVNLVESHIFPRCESSNLSWRRSEGY